MFLVYGLMGRGTVVGLWAAVALGVDSTGLLLLTGCDGWVTGLTARSDISRPTASDWLVPCRLVGRCDLLVWMISNQQFVSVILQDNSRWGD